MQERHHSIFELCIVRISQCLKFGSLAHKVVHYIGWLIGILHFSACLLDDIYKSNAEFFQKVDYRILGQL